MSDQILIDGQVLEVLDGQVRTTIQNLDLAKLFDVVVPHTNTIDAANSPHNRGLFGHSDNPAIRNPEAYDAKKVSVVTDGVPLIIDGRAILMGLSDRMQFSVVSRETDFFNSLADSSLKDLTFDPTLFDYDDGANDIPSWITFPIIETWMNNCDYSTGAGIGGFNAFFQQINVRYMIPFIKKSKLMEQIVEDSDFDVDLTFLDALDNYSNSWVTMQQPDNLDFDNNRTVTIANWMHDVDQAAFFKSVLVQHGCFAMVRGKTVWIGTLDHLQKIKSSDIDWSDKVDMRSDPVISFETGFSVVNEYSYDDWQDYQEGGIQNIVDDNPTEAVDVRVLNYGTITSDNKVLASKLRQDKIVFEPTLEITVDTDEGNPRKIPFIPCFDPVNNVHKATYGIQNIVLPTTVTSYKRTAGGAEAWTFSGGVPPITFDGLLIPWHSNQERHTTVTNSNEDFGLSFSERLLPDHYSYASTVFIRKPYRVQCRMHLTMKDLNRYVLATNFLSTASKYELAVAPIFIKELGGYFHINKISNYQRGKPVTVDLIRI